MEWTGAPLPCLIADRAWDGDAFRAWREQGIEAVIPVRKGCMNPRPHAPEQYQARNAVERGPRLAQGVAARGHPLRQKYAHRFLGFLYLAGVWIWLKPHLNTT